MKQQFELVVASDIICEDIRSILGADLDWKQLAGKTVLITGASGMLAAYLVETLLNVNVVHPELDSIRVIALVRSKAKAWKRFARYVDSPFFAVLEQDVCDKLKTSEPIHIIIHAASFPRPDTEAPLSVLKPNVLGALNLLEYARRSATVEQFVFISSGEVYGVPPLNAAALYEDSFYPLSPTDVRSCYAEGKRAGEALCVAFMREYGVPVKIIRPFHSYGPGMDLDNDPRIFSSLVANIFKGRDIVLASDGSARRSFCYISDAVGAVFYAIIKGEFGIPFNVGNDEMEFSIGELAKELVRVFPERNLAVIFGQGGLKAGYSPARISRVVPGLERIRQLGWTPRISVGEGFRRTVSCYRSTDNVS